MASATPESPFSPNSIPVNVEIPSKVFCVDLVAIPDVCDHPEPPPDPPLISEVDPFTPAPPPIAVNPFTPILNEDSPPLDPT